MEQQIGGLTLTAIFLTVVGVAMFVEAVLSTATRWCGRRLGAAWHRFGPRSRDAASTRERRGHGVVLARARASVARPIPPGGRSAGRARSPFAGGGPTPARLRPGPVAARIVPGARGSQR